MPLPIYTFRFSIFVLEALKFEWQYSQYLELNSTCETCLRVNGRVLCILRSRDRQKHDANDWNKRLVPVKTVYSGRKRITTEAKLVTDFVLKKTTKHWWIKGGAKYTASGPISFHFHAVFSKKISPNN